MPISAKINKIISVASEVLKMPRQGVADNPGQLKSRSDGPEQTIRR